MIAPPPSQPSTIDGLLGQKKVYQCQVSHHLTNNEAASNQLLLPRITTPSKNVLTDQRELDLLK